LRHRRQGEKEFLIRKYWEVIKLPGGQAGQ